MDKADIFEKVYKDLSGAYIQGTFDFIEENHKDLYQKILDKEEEIEVNWDKISEQQFVYMCKSLKKLLLEAIMLRRKYA